MSTRPTIPILPTIPVLPKFPTLTIPANLPKVTIPSTITVVPKPVIPIPIVTVVSTPTIPPKPVQIAPTELINTMKNTTYVIPKLDVLIVQFAYKDRIDENPEPFKQALTDMNMILLDEQTRTLFEQIRTAINTWKQMFPENLDYNLYLVADVNSDEPNLTISDLEKVTNALRDNEYAAIFDWELKHISNVNGITIGYGQIDAESG